MTTAMNIKEKFDQYEYTIKVLTAKLQELADENARLTSALGAHDVLRRIYLDEAECSGNRIKAAGLALGVEKARLQPKPEPLDLTAEVVEPLAVVVERQRARLNFLLGPQSDQASPKRSDDHKVIELLPVSSNRSNGNGDDSSNKD